MNNNDDNNDDDNNDDDNNDNNNKTHKTRVFVCGEFKSIWRKPSKHSVSCKSDVSAGLTLIH